MQAFTQFKLQLGVLPALLATSATERLTQTLPEQSHPTMEKSALKATTAQLARPPQQCVLQAHSIQNLVGCQKQIANFVQLEQQTAYTVHPAVSHAEHLQMLLRDLSNALVSEKTVLILQKTPPADARAGLIFTPLLVKVGVNLAPRLTAFLLCTTFALKVLLGVQQVHASEPMTALRSVNLATEQETPFQVFVVARILLRQTRSAIKTAEQ